MSLLKTIVTNHLIICEYSMTKSTMWIIIFETISTKRMSLERNRVLERRLRFYSLVHWTRSKQDTGECRRKKKQKTYCDWIVVLYWRDTKEWLTKNNCFKADQMLDYFRNATLQSLVSNKLIMLSIHEEIPCFPNGSGSNCSFPEIQTIKNRE